MAITKISKKTTNPDKVVSGTFKVSRQKAKKNIRFITIVTTIVVILLIVLVVWLVKRHNDQQAISLSDTKLSNQQLVKEVSELESQGNQSEAQQLITNQSGSAQSENDLILEAQTYVSNGKIQKALTLEEGIGSKYGLTESLAENIAGLAAQLKQTSTAVGYYDQAISILQAQPSNPTAKQGVPYLQAKVKALQPKS